MTALIRLIGTSSAALYASVASLCILCAACIPLDSNLGGTRPPPDIDNGIPNCSDNSDANGDDGSAPMVFDVTIDASSLTVPGINIDAVLTVVPNIDADVGQLLFTEVTLQDTINVFADPSDTTGIAGGIFLTASQSTEVPEASFFDLTVTDDGTVTAVFIEPGVPGPNPNLFILQSEGDVFQPGVIGVTYQVQSGSRFSFRVEGDRVSGQLDLNGPPINDIGPADTYVGTFSGSLRP